MPRDAQDGILADVRHDRPGAAIRTRARTASALAAGAPPGPAGAPGRAGPIRSRARILVGAAVVGLALAALAAALAPLGWPFELFAHFRLQLVVATAVALVLAALVRGRWMLGVVVFAIGCQGWPALGPASDASARSADLAPNTGSHRCSGPVLRVASVNLYFRNANAQPVRQWLREHPADVVVLQEFTPEWERALAPEIAAHPHRLLLAREDPYGLALLSRVPLANARPVDFAEDGLPSLVAAADLGGRPLQILGMHTHWPVVPGLQRARDLGLANAAALVRESAVPTVLVGDLNLTPYAPAFAQLLDDSGLVDAFADRWWRPTWQAGFWPLAIPIDHALVPASACVVHAEIGPDVGSDHRPIHVTLALP